MDEKIPEPPPASERRHRTAKAARGATKASGDAAGELPNQGSEESKRPAELAREHEDDRSPADPHDWQDEWDRARWAP
ncbi:hypothetical protein VMT65_04530 [Nocardia sp. CDC153]|uniref:hypothetical protein n=1 Tax=Nocardia sp. CDC153 TaxID=3112167 RepID=UPI002DB90127|nr:hypothetical protein [Nocardia sp. CDC153]MEC3952296.1 hypothetical protein [Nocardia sp. CDC153]